MEDEEEEKERKRGRKGMLSLVIEGYLQLY